MEKGLDDDIEDEPSFGADVRWLCVHCLVVGVACLMWMRVTDLSEPIEFMH